MAANSAHAPNSSSKRKAIRVCVLSPSYEDSEAATKEFDDFDCTPAYWMKDDPNYEFSNCTISKSCAYSQVIAASTPVCLVFITIA